MNWNTWIRQIHRWMSIVFTVVVAAIFVTAGRWASSRPSGSISCRLPLAFL